MSNLPPLLLVPTPLPTAAPGDEEEAVVPPPKRESGSIVLLKDLPEDLRTLLLQPIISEKLGYDLRTTTRIRVSDLCEILSEFCAKSTREGGWVGLHDMCKSPNNDVWRQACSYFGVKGKFFKFGQSEEDMTWREMFFKLCSMFHWKAQRNSAYFLEQMRLLRIMLLGLNRDMLPGEQPPTLEGYAQPPDSLLAVHNFNWQEMVQNCATLVENLAKLVKVRWGLRMLFDNALSFLEEYESMPDLDQSQQEWVDEMRSYIKQMQTQSGYPALTEDEIEQNRLIFKGIKDNLKGLKLAYKIVEDGTSLLPEDYRKNHLMKILRFSIVAGVDLTFLGTMVTGIYFDWSLVAECVDFLLDMGMTLDFINQTNIDVDPNSGILNSRPWVTILVPVEWDGMIPWFSVWILENYRENNDIMELLVRLFKIARASSFKFKNEDLLSIVHQIWDIVTEENAEESRNALEKLKALLETIHPLIQGRQGATVIWVEYWRTWFRIEAKLKGEAGPSGVDHSKDGEEENG